MSASTNPPKGRRSEGPGKAKDGKAAQATRLMNPEIRNGYQVQKPANFKSRYSGI